MQNVTQIAWRGKRDHHFFVRCVMYVIAFARGQWETALIRSELSDFLQEPCEITVKLLKLLLLSIALVALDSQAFGYGGNSGSHISGTAATPADPDYVNGVAAIKSGQYADGIKALEAYTARVKTDADAENWLGFAYRKSGALDAAFAHYDIALTLDPWHRGAHEYLGEAYLQAGNLPKAEEHLKILAGLCASSCREYSMLKTSIADYEKNHPSVAVQ